MTKEVPAKVKRKLSDILEEKAVELISVWAERNKNTLWLGGPSRELVKDEIVEALRSAYDLAKNKYNKD